MLASRLVVVCLSLTLWCQSLRADESQRVATKTAVGQQVQYELGLKLTGEINVASGAKTITMNLAAQAQHRFHERVLTADEQGQALRVVRHYDGADAQVNVNGNVTKRTLRPERRLLVAQTLRGKTVTYSPSGPLTREELELTADHFDVLAVQGIFPVGEVASGASWEVPSAVVQALLGYDGLIHHVLRGEVKSSQGKTQVHVSGKAVGIIRGSEVTTEVDGTFDVDLKEQRWTGGVWTQTDERRQGPIDPAAKIKATITLQRRFDADSPALADDAVGKLPAEPTDSQLLLSFKDVKTGGEFLVERGWHVVAQTDQYAVLRLLERGELIGQLNVTPYERVKPGQHVSPDDLKKHVQSVPGLTVDQVVQNGVVPAEGGHWIYRLSVAGRAGDLDMLHNFYAVAGPQGHQLILSFATELANAERMGGKDLSIVGSVTLPK